MPNLQAFVRERKTGKALLLDQGGSCRFSCPYVSYNTYAECKTCFFGTREGARVSRRILGMLP